jgi:cell division protein FtsB
MSTTTNIISDKSPIALGLVISATGTLVGGVLWLSAVQATGAMTASETKALKEEVKEMKAEFTRDIKHMLESQARIEGALGIKRSKGREE